MLYLVGIVWALSHIVPLVYQRH